MGKTNVARSMESTARAKALTDTDIAQARSEQILSLCEPDDPHFCGLCATRNVDGVCRTPWCRNGGAK